MNELTLELIETAIEWFALHDHPEPDHPDAQLYDVIDRYVDAQQ